MLQFALPGIVRTRQGFSSLYKCLRAHQRSHFDNRLKRSALKESLIPQTMAGGFSSNLVGFPSPFSMIPRVSYEPWDKK